MAEKGLIDANVLDNELLSHMAAYSPETNRKYKPIYDTLPTVEAVGVVRCEHCKYNDPSDIRDMSGYFICRHTNLYMNDDDYCSYGKKKESEGK